MSELKLFWVLNSTQPQVSPLLQRAGVPVQVDGPALRGEQLGGWGTHQKQVPQMCRRLRQPELQQNRSLQRLQSKRESRELKELKFAKGVVKCYESICYCNCRC